MGAIRLAKFAKAVVTNESSAPLSIRANYTLSDITTGRYRVGLVRSLDYPVTGLVAIALVTA